MVSDAACSCLQRSSPSLSCRSFADTGNWHNKLRGFHLRNDSSKPGDPSLSAGPHQGPDYMRYPIPDAINFMTYLQPSELRILPHSHADFTELSSGEFNSERSTDLCAGPLSHCSFHPLWPAAPDPVPLLAGAVSGSAKAPHPRERVISCEPGQVIAFHHNTLHSGMYNNSAAERRYYVSLFYTRLGLRSRNIPELVDEMPPSHPLHAVLDKAVAERDEQVLSLFGKQHDRSLSSALRLCRNS